MQNVKEQPPIDLHPLFIKQGQCLVNQDLDGLMDLYHTSSLT